VAPTAPDDEPPFHVPIEDWLDLHSFAPRDVPSVVDEYLIEARARGFTEEKLEQVEKALAAAFDIKFVFNK